MARMFRIVGPAGGGLCGPHVQDCMAHRRKIVWCTERGLCGSHVEDCVAHRRIVGPAGGGLWL